jgi:hypothetical protein
MPRVSESVNSYLGGVRNAKVVQVQYAPLDAAIHAVYAQFDEGIDDILVSPSRAIEFADKVRASSPPVASFSDEEILRRAMALRKLGEDQGGLPRKQRKYRGRRAK